MPPGTILAPQEVSAYALLLRIITDENHAGLLVNLAYVNFIDSTGVGVLVGIWHRVGATNRGLALAAPSGHTRRVLKTTGLAKAF